MNNMSPFDNISAIGKLTSYEFESLCRYFSSYAMLGEKTGLARILTRYKMFVDTTDSSLVPHLVMDGFWETPVTQSLVRLVKPGDVCVDVGAHLGYFSILMSALAGEEGKTLAVEPNVNIAAMLRRTAAINHPGFIVWEGALTNETKELEIHIPKSKTGDSSLLVRADSGEEGFIHQSVLATTMDQLLVNLDIGNVNVIKIDAEGAEPFIFEGMEGVLKKNKELMIVMEFSPYLYRDPEAFSTYLLGRFDVYKIASGFNLEETDAGRFSEWSGLKSHVDLLLAPKGTGRPY